MTQSESADNREETKPSRKFFGGSVAVAAGILASRLAGLIRQSVFAYYFGNTSAADVFNAAFRIPNLLQNLFGEGALSASFIPVYARLRAEGKKEEAREVAWAVACVLAFATSLLVLVGVLATPLLIDLIAPGFTGERREETIRLVQLFFPGAGLLVLSAWCLGVLNSHRFFFLSYVAPVVWSGAIVVSLLLAGGANEGYRLAEWAAWGSVAGSFLQVVVQLPKVLRLVGSPRGGFGISLPPVRQVLRNFLPVSVSRGVVQISAYVDQIIASFLPVGAVAALAYAQVLYTLPVSLFGMSISAAELPEMSSAVGSPDEVNNALRQRLAKGLGRIAFFVVPSVAAMGLLGDMLAAFLFQRGRFGHEDALYVWVILMGSCVGLLAATFARLYASVFFALGDTRSPLRYAVIRVALTIALGYLFALQAPRLLGFDPRLGTVGLTFSAGIAGWIEYFYLRRGLEAKIGPTGIRKGGLKPIWFCALLSAGIGLGTKIASQSLAAHHPFLQSSLVIAAYGVAYLAFTHLFSLPEALEVSGRIKRLLGRG